LGIKLAVVKTKRDAPPFKRDLASREELALTDTWMSDWCSERSFRRALDESQNSQSWKNLSQYDPYPPLRRAALKMPRRAVWSASNLYFLVLIRLIGEDRNSEFVGLPKSNAGLPTERATSSRPRSTSSREVVAGNPLEACLRNLRSCPAFARLST